MRKQIAIAIVCCGLAACGQSQETYNAENLRCIVEFEFQNPDYASVGMYGVGGLCRNEGDKPIKNVITNIQVCDGSTVKTTIPFTISYLDPQAEYDIDTGFDSSLLPFEANEKIGLEPPYGNGCS